MKKLLIAAIMLVSSITMNAQNYDWSVGIRGGYGSGTLNARHYLNPSNAFELAGSLFFDGWGWELSGIYEWAQPVTDNGLEFYYGLGAQAGTHSEYFSFGAVGVVGFEYAVPTIPLCFFLDYRPRLTCTSGVGLGIGYTDLGLGLRIRF